MTNAKDLLQGDAIRTMQKDMKRLKKAGFMQQAPQQAPRTINVIQKEKTSEYLPAEQPLKQEANDREMLRKILEESARQRHEIEHKQVGTQNVVPGATNNAMSKTAITPPQETKLDEKEWLKKVPLAAKETLLTKAKVEEDQRKKFLEGIEAWASESDEN